MAWSPFARVSEQGRVFLEALAAAPEPRLGWDVGGARSLLHRLGWLLLHEKTAPRELAAAVFVGVMIGCSPFYGLHTALVLVMGFALGLNKIAMWVASNVSLPFIAPFIAFASMQVGHVLVYGESLPMTLEGVRALANSGDVWQVGLSLWLDWLAGAAVVGGLLGALGAVVTWRVAAGRERRSSAAE